MDIFIKTQDDIIGVFSVSLGADNTIICNCFLNRKVISGFVLARYATPERVQEVFSDLCSVIKFAVRSEKSAVYYEMPEE